MAQEVTPLTTGSIKQNEAQNEGELVRPNDVVTVYSTGSTPHTKAGEPMEVHTLLADKLIEQGKATKDAPKEKKSAKAE